MPLKYRTEPRAKDTLDVLQPSQLSRFARRYKILLENRLQEPWLPLRGGIDGTSLLTCAGATAKPFCDHSQNLSILPRRPCFGQFSRTDNKPNVIRSTIPRYLRLYYKNATS